MVDVTDNVVVPAPRSSRRRRLRLFNALFGAVLLICAAVVAIVVARTGSNSPAPSSPNPALLPIDIAAPDFALTGQFGQRVTLTEYRGKTVVLAFVDSECTTVCPLTTATMTAATDELGTDAARVQLLGIDANPLAATVSAVHSYSATHDLLYRWNFLTGSRAELSTVWAAYHVYTAVTKTGIDHDPVVIVIDPAGRERAIFHTAMSYASVAVQAASLAQAAGATLGVSPARTRSPASTSVILPSASLTLPAVAGTPAEQVQLGPGHPHLVVFLASWLTQTSDLRSEMSALDDYQRLAVRDGLPSLVGIDLVTTEPRSGSMVSTLRSLGIKPRFPIVSDEHGAVADGYQAQAAPWFSLTTTKGTLSWQHDGWLAAEPLAASVRRASNTR